MTGLVLLFFVTSDCPIANGYAPEIQRVCRDYRADGVTCSLVYEDADISDAAVRRHVAEYRYGGLRTVVDRDRAIARRSGASVTPEAVLIDGAGKIRYRGRIDDKYVDVGKPRRVVTVHDLRDAIDAVLAGRPVARPATTALGCHIPLERSPADTKRKRTP